MARIPFLTWTVNNAKDRVMAGLDLLATQANRLFYAGEHWQAAFGWIGPIPKISTDPGEAGARATSEAHWFQSEIERGFVSKNVVAEVVDRHRDGVIGTEPDWSFTIRRALKEEESPTDGEQRAIDDAEALLTEWWDRREIHKKLKSAVTKLLYAAGTLDAKSLQPAHTCLRLFIPSGLLDDVPVAQTTPGEEPRTVRGVRLTQGDLAGALKKIYLDVPEPDQANVWTDTTDMTMLDVGIFVATDAKTGQDMVEMTFLDANGATVIKSQTGTADATQTVLDLGGRLTMHRVERATFLTPQVRQNQKALNLEASMVPRNATLAGFLERIILNAEVPGHWETDATGGKKFVPDPYYSGAATLNWLRGVMVDTPTGGKTLATPSVHTHEPTPPTAIIEAKRDSYRDILEETDQLHALLMADAVASGESRKQARGEFETSLRDTRIGLESAGRWVLETALAMAETLAGSRGRYTDMLRATFTCRLDTGPLSDAEQTTIVAQVAGGIKSRATGMSEMGVSDPDAELGRIMEQDGGNLDVRTKKATIYKLYIDAGCTEDVAAELAGLSDEERQVIEKMVKDAPPPVPPVLPTDPNARPVPTPTPAPGGARPPVPRPAPPAPTPTPQPGTRPAARQNGR